VTPDAALRALVTAKPPGRPALDLSALPSAGLLICAAVGLAFVPSAARFFHFTTFIWPFAFMIGLWGQATSIVHRSRLLWLRMPGSREIVRWEIERALLRNLGRFALALLGFAVLYASPLVAAPPREVLAGFALSICAGLFAIYAALAAIPGNLVHLTAFALLILAQMGLLARPSPALTDAVIVTAIELVGALAFRAFALACWRRVDWLRLRPLSASNMFRIT
jgi:hypothetical protein